jgi:hypothetical protein
MRWTLAVTSVDQCAASGMLARSKRSIWHVCVCCAARRTVQPLFTVVLSVNLTFQQRQTTITTKGNEMKSSVIQYAILTLALFAVVSVVALPVAHAISHTFDSLTVAFPKTNAEASH